MQQEVKSVRTQDTIPFHCKLCGQCCRNIEGEVMLEALDAYRLGRYLRARTSMVQTIEDVYSWFASPAALEDYYPIFVLLTSGKEQACTLLEHGRCTVYEARPRVCRLYPFSVDTGRRGKDFAYYQCLDRNQAHFDPVYGGRVSVKDWFHQNFSKEDRSYFLAEAEALPQLGRLLRKMPPRKQKEFLFKVLYHRYFNFDLDQPFLEQYRKNQEALLAALRAEQ